MSTSDIIVISIFVCILAADITVRLVIARRKKDHLVRDLLDILHELGFASEMGGHSAAAGRLPSESLGESLLRHFIQSSLSCRIVNVLAAHQTGIREADIAAAVNAGLMARNRRPVPEPAVRKVLMILMGADFVSLRHGALSLTGLGRQLHHVLRERQGAARLPALAMRTSIAVNHHNARVSSYE